MTHAVIVAMALAWPGEAAEDLAPPVRVEADGRPIDVEREGHSAPYFGDFDGDGLPDLLVGQYHEGRLRIYRNRGSAGEPRFSDYEWFQDGADTGRVPVG